MANKQGIAITTIPYARQIIGEIDRRIDANHAKLRCRTPGLDPYSAASWQAAWDANPDLHQQENALFRERGAAQDIRDKAEALQARKLRRPHRHPLGRQTGAQQMTYYVIDSFGRSYEEGQTYKSRTAAVSAAKQIAEDDRPYGVWIASDDDGDAGEEIYPALIA